MSDYQGVIIEESLRNESVLNKLDILSTKASLVMERHKTPWLKQWTLHTVHIIENRAQEIAQEISRSFDEGHPGSWYADFKNATHHYIIFPNKIFLIDRESDEEYQAARQYALSLGIPDYQCNFHSDVKDQEKESS